MTDIRKRHLLRMALPFVVAVGCAPTDEQASVPALQQRTEAVTGEDGIADAYATFKNLVSLFGFDHRLPIGYAFHPGLVTTPVVFNGQHPKGNAVLDFDTRSEEHTSELQSQSNLVCRLLLEKK